MRKNGWLTQEIVDRIDKTTEDGFAEALMICISSLVNEQGLLISVRLGETIEQQIAFSNQIAKMMLHKKEDV